VNRAKGYSPGFVIPDFHYEICDWERDSIQANPVLPFSRVVPGFSLFGTSADYLRRAVKPDC